MNPYAPPEIREPGETGRLLPAPVTITVRTDTRDRALVVAYMKESFAKSRGNTSSVLAQSVTRWIGSSQY